jgi:hypothetical protein
MFSAFIYIEEHGDILEDEGFEVNACCCKCSNFFAIILSMTFIGLISQKLSNELLSIGGIAGVTSSVDKYIPWTKKN